MTLLDAAWQKQGEDHSVLFTREIVTHKKREGRIKDLRIVAGRRERGREGKTWFALAVLIRICGVMLCKGNTAGSLIIMTRTNSPC